MGIFGFGEREKAAEETAGIEGRNEREDRQKERGMVEGFGFGKTEGEVKKAKKWKMNVWDTVGTCVWAPFIFNLFFFGILYSIHFFILFLLVFLLSGIGENPKNTTVPGSCC